ncbi:hypothetical protein TNCV_1494961 [Trichonephila clavipes]|nr:hypothetical protein TNCV_1494961 [Trichonephila clavipes]
MIELSFFIVIFLTWITPLSENPSRISASGVVNRSDYEITPLQEFSVLCGLMGIGEFRKDLASKKELVCRAEFVSMSKLPDQRRRIIPFDFQRTSLAGLTLDSATSSGLGETPALQCRTPSMHHLELQDRLDYAPADRAARTCWLVCAGLLYYLVA